MAFLTLDGTLFKITQTNVIRMIHRLAPFYSQNIEQFQILHPQKCREGANSFTVLLGQCTITHYTATYFSHFLND